jgi:GNAT superfamily N-acetyltransferase
MAPMELTVRQMSRADLDVAVEWAEAEGWGPGRGDADAFWAADPAVCWALELDGTMIASLSAVRNSGGIVFMGFYIVAPEHRGTGLGIELWNNVWARLEGHTLAGDAVPEQVRNYEKDGFRVAHRNSRFIADRLPAPSPGTGAVRIVEAPKVPFELLAEFDGEHAFGPRPKFLEKWIAPADRRSLVALDADDRIVGFGAVRRATACDRVGPLFAAGTDVARELLLGLAEGRNAAVGIDVPLPNEAAVEMVEQLGMTPSFETARIYRGDDPGIPLNRIFGITSLELG